MKVTKCRIPGLIVIEPSVFGDGRGFFMETWQKRRYQETGLPGDFVQDNLSASQRGVLRGLHVQNPHSQGKLVSVIQGEVFDVAVDLRRGSPTFGQHEAVVLSGENKKQFYVPEGFAHGFCVLSETAVFAYKCTDYYSKPDEFGVLWNDPDLAIAWPIQDVVLSEKDAQLPRLRDIAPEKFVAFGG